VIRPLAIRLAAHLRLQGVQQSEIQGVIEDMIKSLGLTKCADTLVGNEMIKGISGGEKKRNEILQMLLLEPKLAILDETDSGLDIDALKTVAAGVNQYKGDDNGIIIITHYQRLLDYIQPDFVHVMYEGKLVRSGGKDLAYELEEAGYAFLDSS